MKSYTHSEADRTDTLAELIEETVIPGMNDADKAFLRRLKLLLLPIYGILTLYVFLLAPLYVQLSNDILYMGTLFPDILAFLLAVADIFVFIFAYGILLYALYRFSFRAVTGLLLLYGGAILYKNLGNLLMTYLTDGLPTANDISFDLISVAAYILLEAIQCALVLLVSHKILYAARKREEIRRAAAEQIPGKTYTPTTPYFPFERLFSFTSPVQKACFWTAFVPMSAKVLSRIIYDLGVGLPSGISEVLVMILYYGADIVGYGLILYFAMLLLLSRLNQKDAVDSNPEET